MINKIRNEKWMPVVGFEGMYEVSDRGRVKSIERMAKSRKRADGTTYYRRVPEKVLSQYDSSGYRKVDLVHNGRREKSFVHRLVAEAFIDNPGERPQVNHLDRDRTNNRLSNLEWSTRAENIAHAVADGWFLDRTYVYVRDNILDELERDMDIAPREIQARTGASMDYIYEIRREYFEVMGI